MEQAMERRGARAQVLVNRASDVWSDGFGIGQWQMRVRLWGGGGDVPVTPAFVPHLRSG